MVGRPRGPGGRFLPTVAVTYAPDLPADKEASARPVPAPTFRFVNGRMVRIEPAAE